MKKLVTATLILTLSALLTAPCTAQEELKKLLETRKVTVNFNDTPLGDIVDFLTDISTRPWLVDQKSDLSEKPVTLLLKDVTMLEFLDKLCKKVEGLDFRLSCGAVILGKNKDLGRLPQTEPIGPKDLPENQQAVWDATAAAKLDVDVIEVSLSNLVKSFAGPLAKKGVRVTLKGKGEKTLSLRAKSHSALQLLHLVAALAEAKLTFKDGEWVFESD